MVVNTLTSQLACMLASMVELRPTQCNIHKLQKNMSTQRCLDMHYFLNLGKNCKAHECTHAHYTSIIYIYSTRQKKSTILWYGITTVRYIIGTEKHFKCN